MQQQQKQFRRLAKNGNTHKLNKQKTNIQTLKSIFSELFVAAATSKDRTTSKQHVNSRQSTRFNYDKGCRQHGWPRPNPTSIHRVWRTSQSSLPFHRHHSPTHPSSPSVRPSARRWPLGSWRSRRRVVGGNNYVIY